MPSLARRDSVGVWMGPPKASGKPKPTSSSMMIRMLGAPLGKWVSAGNGTSLDSCSVGPAILVLGFGRNGRTEPSVAGDVWANENCGAARHKAVAIIKADDDFPNDVPVIARSIFFLIDYFVVAPNTSGSLGTE